MKRNIFFPLIVFLILFAGLQEGLTATYTVTNIGDNGPGTLRQAIVDANNNFGKDLIDFNIPGTGVHTISLLSALPPLTDQNGVTIDGYTQGIAQPNTQPQGTPPDAILLIEITSTPTYPLFGIYIQTWRNDIKGLVINGFHQGIIIDGSIDNAMHNNILGCYIGTDASGMVGVGTPGTGAGIEITSSAGGFIGIGDGTPGGRNVISNNYNGILVNGCSGIGVYGNYIGTDKTGIGNLGNAMRGILIEGEATNNIIGGQSGARNIISGNNTHGVEIRDAGTSYNSVIGNYIGITVNGTLAFGNTRSGVRIANGATNNTIGSHMNNQCGNVISGNGGPIGYSGVDILNPGTSNNTVEGNYIGTNYLGTSAIANTGNGVSIFLGATNNSIGGLHQNVISGNAANGVWIEGTGTNNNYVTNNLIGLDATGLVAMANTLNGVLVNNGAQSNNIGPGSTNANFISGNTQDGIKIENSNTNSNIIKFNRVGINTAYAAIGNGGNGIQISDNASGTQIGGANPFDGNFITHNSGHGILIDNAQNTLVISYPQIFIQPNVIHFNAGDGISVTNTLADGNTFCRNEIHGNGGLGIDLGNNGVTLNDPSDPDNGPNQEVNFPVINNANYYYIAPPSGTTRISGTLDIDTNPLQVVVEIFETGGSSDPSGYGEGSTYLGNTVPNASGNWSVDVTGCQSGDIITATTTDVNGNTSEFCQNFNVIAMDFGDADYTIYPTLITSNGARHIIVTGAPWLGDASDSPDADVDGLPPSPIPLYSMGDDLTFMDDEDGVTIPSLYAGLQATITFEVINGPAWVDGWIDFDGSGTWGDITGEQIISASYTTGIHNVIINVPSASKAMPTYARFRINSTGALSPTGLANDGEVEDHGAFIFIQWVGGATGDETDWLNPANWSNSVVPTSSTSVAILSSATYLPVVSGTADCYDLLIEDGAQLTVNTGGNLTIYGTFTIGEGTSGTFIMNGGLCTVNNSTNAKSGATMQINAGIFKP